MNLEITLWKLDPLNPYPFSPVQRTLKFSAVFGTYSANNSKISLPSGFDPIEISKNTFVFLDAIFSFN